VSAWDSHCCDNYVVLATTQSSKTGLWHSTHHLTATHTHSQLNKLLLLLLQGFVRSTTKYWVRAEDVSVVKYHILQHLPVFQHDKDNFAGDAQLINSVYFDNENLELYHGRLDKKPNAIAVRIR
jgi:SPX domain protein involved in polyphosphate accumulation